MCKSNHSGTLDKAICFVAYRTALSVRQYRIKQFKANGFNVTAEQWRVLHRLWEEDGLSQNEISKRLFKQEPNITRIVDNLEKNNLVVRKSVENNRRKYRVFLTEKGRDLTEKLRTISKEALDKACKGIEQADISAAIDVLNKIYKNIENV